MLMVKYQLLFQISVQGNKYIRMNLFDIEAFDL